MATIAPAEMFDTNSDIPNLMGKRNGDPKVPGPDILQEGAPYHWDVSRRIYSVYFDSDPPTILRSDYDTNRIGNPSLDAHVHDFPSTYVEVIKFPDDPLIGNDDATDADEDDNPYSADDELGHGTGIDMLFKAGVAQIASFDQPAAPSIRKSAGQVGETARMVNYFQEFARLQLGNTWYIISSNVDWSYTARFRRQTDGMIDDGSDVTPAEE